MVCAFITTCVPDTGSLFSHSPGILTSHLVAAVPPDQVPVALGLLSPLNSIPLISEAFGGPHRNTQELTTVSTQLVPAKRVT